MNHKFQRITALALMLVMVVSAITVFPVTADAATITYRYDGEYVYNWGTREEVADFLSPMAEEFYAKYNVTYESLAANSGGTSQSNAPKSDLYEALHELMEDAHSYQNSYNASRPLFKYTDCEGSGYANNGKISSFYSGVGIGPDWDGGSTWNREHTWPNSKGLEGRDEDDIMMLRPTASSENFSRGNKGYGEGSGYYHPNSESDGTHDVRGDVARIFLYVYVRWENINGNGEHDTWGSDGVIQSVEILLKWMEEDPVDTWELGRNDSVQSITGTRNVFVDYPEFAFLLFGEEIPSDMTTPSGEAKNGTATPDVECKHTYSNNCDATCNICGATRVPGFHSYSNACDTSCNICGAIRVPGAHRYSGACDADCNICGATRVPGEHTYDGNCDIACNVCGSTRAPGEHTYSNACDADCDICGATRVPGEHSYANACDADCDICGATRVPGEHSYTNSCDADCNICGATRVPGEHSYTNACDADCNICGATRVPGEHSYANACDADCDICGAVRIPGEHSYTNNCDADCDICGAVRVPSAHIYANNCDTTCDVCGATRAPGEHTYTNGCDATCNVCGATRVPGEHSYNGSCDADCDICGATRTPGNHVYDAYCDTDCNYCGATRETRHLYIGWQVTVEATGEAAGLEVGYCLYCKAETEREIPKLEAPAEPEPETPVIPPEVEEPETPDNPTEDIPEDIPEDEVTDPPCQTPDQPDAEESEKELSPLEAFFKAIADFFSNLFANLFASFTGPKQNP